MSHQKSQVRSANDDRYFETSHLKQDLAGRTVRGGAVTLGMQLLKFGLSTIATIVVARLLKPQDYGLVGMVTVMVSFLWMFLYMGLPAVTVKWEQLTHNQVSTLFWVNVLLSGGIALAMIVSSPLLAWIYHEPRLIGIALGYAAVSFLTGISIQHLALLQRQMRFVAITFIDIAALVVGLCVTILAALRGFGYWSLVLNQIVFALVTIAGAFTVCRWRPGWPQRGSGVRPMLTFGGNLTGYSFTSFLAQNTDNALIGKFWGAYELGIYSRAYQMLLMPLSQINMPLSAVTIPALSRLVDSPDQYAAAYRKMLEKLAMVSMPAVAFVIVTSDWSIQLLLGPQWRGAARIFTLLGMAAIIQPVRQTAIWLFITQGRSREMFKWGVLSSIIAVVSILSGLPWGATGVAATYGATDLCLTTPLLFWYAGRRGPVAQKDFYRTIAPAACAAICSLSALWLVRPWLEFSAHLSVRLMIAAIITFVLSFSVMWALPAGRLALRNFKQMLVLVVKRKGEFAVQP